MWIQLAIVSALFLGLYDISKKHSLVSNAVIPVLFLANLFGFLFILPIIFLSISYPGLAQEVHGEFQSISTDKHVLLFIKSLIVTTSWIFAFYGLKHLPISIASPIRASGPFWTLILAVSFFGEMPDGIQWLALAIILVSYYYFSIIGLKEGIVFHRNKWILFTIIATLLGTASSLYDKHLLQKSALKPLTVQFWFSFYCVILMGTVMLIYKKIGNQSSIFEWRWSIPMIGLLLLIADFLYFSALHHKESLVTLVSAVRRSSVIISFLVGGILFKDLNKRKKALGIIGIITGIFILIYHT